MLVSLCYVSKYVFLATTDAVETDKVQKLLRRTNNEHPLSHYMICESDRLRIDERSILNLVDSISFTVKQQVSIDSWKDHTLSFPAMICGRNSVLRVEGPTVWIHSDDGRSVHFPNVATFIQMLAQAKFIIPTAELEDLIRLHVVYVGRTTISQRRLRLRGHEKIQASLSEIVAHRPHRELWIKLMAFQPPFIIAAAVPEINSKWRDDWMPGKGLLEKLPVQQAVSVIEGALIRYFEPKMNIQFKNLFPSRAHKSYKYLYQKSIRSIRIELHEEWMIYSTGSDKVAFKKRHSMAYSIAKDKSEYRLSESDPSALYSPLLGGV